MSNVADTSIPMGSQSDRLSVDEARARIRSEVVPVREIESCALRAALGRVLARDIVSPIDVPAHTNSAVDGYALAGDELPIAPNKELRVVGTAWAGRPYTGAMARGECVHIMTGAPMPRGADTVVIQEHVDVRGERISVRGDQRRGQNVRAAGEDLTKGQIALAVGKRLAPAELGLIASLGFAEVPVYRRVRAAYFCTGDELRGVGEALAEGQIYDSNRYTLFGMLTQLGVEVQDLGVVRDDPTAVRQAFTQAATHADIVITTGGVSVGEADHVKDVLASLGKVSFWQIAMRPGRPIAFGRVGNAAFFGLPGNPVAVMVTFYQIVQPVLRHIMGESPSCMAPTFRARSLSRLRTRVGRTEFIRGIVSRDDQGELVVRSTGDQGSGILSSMSVANCFVILAPEVGDAEPGALVEVQLFNGVL